MRNDHRPIGVMRPSIVADALAFIEQHCLEAITLEQIATAVSRSPSCVTSVLTRSTGKSAGAWITAGRMSSRMITDYRPRATTRIGCARRWSRAL